MSDVESGKPSISASERPRVEAFGVPAKFALAIKLSENSAAGAVVEFGGPLLADRGPLDFCAHGLVAESMGSTLMPATSAARRP